MLPKTIIAAVAIAALGLMVPGTALARGGFGGGGVHGGGFHGGFGGAGFRAAPIGGAGFRAIGPVGPRAGGLGYGPRPGWGAGWRGAGWRHHGHWRGGFWPGVAIGVGIAGGWPYYAGYYDNPYYDDPYYYYSGGYGGCYPVRQRVMTPRGWRIRRVDVCE